MSKGYFERVHQWTPTRFWVNNPTVSQARLAIRAGAINCTTNPTYTAKMLAAEEMRPILTDEIRRAKADAKSESDVAARVQREAVRMLLREFEPLYSAHPGREGFVSLQGDPYLEHDPQNIIDEALLDREMGVNLIAKIPVTRAGLEAIEYLAKKDCPIIATEIMSVSQCVAACEAYRRAGGSGAFFVTCIAGIFDDCLKNQLAAGEISVEKDILFQAGCALMRREYRVMRERGLPGILLGGGARGLHHFTEFVGGACDITINWTGTADKLLEADAPVISRMDTPTPDYVLDELTAKVPTFAKAYAMDGLNADEYSEFPPVKLFRSQFEAGWDQLLKEVRNA